jgi:peptide/nickel transport system substrate-binding protein
MASDRAARRAGRGRRRAPRRNLVAGVVGSALLAASVLPSSSAGAAPSTGSHHGILKYGLDINDTFSNTFDPGLSTNDCGYAVYQNIYSSALAPANNAVLPSIVQSWTTTPTSVTLHLRPGVVFSNGDPVTASDVEASITHIKTSPYRFTLTYIQSMTVVNPTTLVLNLNTPYPGDVLWALTYLDGMVMDPASIPTAGTDPVGAGPFVLKSYQQGSSIDLVANPKYYDPSAYPLGGVDFIQVSPGPQSVGALESGAVDMIDLEPENLPQVKADPNLGIAVTKSYDYVLMQLRQDEAPFNNEKIRAALEYGINRAAINSAVFDGLGEPAYQPWPNWSDGYNKSIGEKYRYDPKKAKALLAAAGFPKGVTFTLALPSGDESYQRIALIMQSELAAAGFTMIIKQVDPSDITTEVYLHGVGNALLSEELTNGPDLANNFESEYLGNSFGSKELGTKNPSIIPYINQALTSISASVQGPIMQKAGALALSEGTEVPVVFQPSIIAYNKSVVGGHVTAPIGQCRTDLAGITIKK